MLSDTNNQLVQKLFRPCSFFGQFIVFIRFKLKWIKLNISRNPGIPHQLAMAKQDGGNIMVWGVSQLHG